MTKEQIDDCICEIMYFDGPDRHVDGHEIIVDFIVNLIAGKGDLWFKQYLKRKKGGRLP